MADQKATATVPVAEIARSIHFLRSQRILLDADLAALYGVTTKALNQAVKRNATRFPADFIFRLTSAEVQALNRSQIVTGSQKHRNSRFPPLAFTEHGAIMAATVLNSPRAVTMSVYVVRAFVQLRTLLSSNRELARRLDQLEARVTRKLTIHDREIAALIGLIRELTRQPEPRRRPIGFTVDIDKPIDSNK